MLFSLSYNSNDSNYWLLPDILVYLMRDVHPFLNTCCFYSQLRLGTAYRSLCSHPCTQRSRSVYIRSELVSVEMDDDVSTILVIVVTTVVTTVVVMTAVCLSIQRVMQRLSTTNQAIIRVIFASVWERSSGVQRYNCSTL